MRQSVTRLFVSAFFAFSTATISAAGPVDDAYELHKNDGVDLQPIGTICEYLAKDVLEKRYDPDFYRVVIGVQYGESRNAMGELDLTVVDLEYNEAVFIGEVKCWKDPRAGLAKAKKQINRFRKANDQNRVNWLKILSPGYTDFVVSKRTYRNSYEVGYVAPKGTRKAGYTHELDLTLDQAMDLRRRIMNCQESGKCKRPKKSKKRR